MAEKQLPCCARLTGRLVSDENNLRVLAQRAAFADSRGRNIDKFKASIAEAKQAIVDVKQAIVDHEAEHADGAAA